MIDTLIEFLLQIPVAVGNLGTWIISPINERYLNISPLGLLGAAGTSILIGLIVVHVVKLFIG